MKNPRVTHGSIADCICGYADRNLECAGIILDNPNRYGGEGSLMVSWARTIVKNSQSGGFSAKTNKRLASDLGF